MTRTREQTALINYLLTKLAEECLEVGQRCTKAITFGIDECQPGQPMDNMQRIMDELEDVRVIVEFLRDEGVLTLGPIDEGRFRAKVEKVLKYMQYSREVGALRDIPGQP